MQYKIRAAQEQKVPYMVVLGDREIEARTASPRTRAGEQQEPQAWEAFADRVAAESSGPRTWLSEYRLATTGYRGPQVCPVGRLKGDRHRAQRASRRPGDRPSDREPRVCRMRSAAPADGLAGAGFGSRHPSTAASGADPIRTAPIDLVAIRPGP